MKFDIWKRNEDLSFDVLLSPASLKEYKELLESMNVTVEILIDDYQK